MRFNIDIKPILYVLLCALLYISCDVNDSNKFRETFSYQIRQQSTIQLDSMQRTDRPDSLTVQTFSVEAGDSTVFSFERNITPPDDVLDGGFFETLVFQISPDADRFEFTEADFADAHAFYRRSCFCELSGAAFQVTDGVIRGERLSPIHWIVSANVTVQSPVGTFRVEFEEPFYVK